MVFGDFGVSSWIHAFILSRRLTRVPVRHSPSASQDACWMYGSALSEELTLICPIPATDQINCRRRIARILEKVRTDVFREGFQQVTNDQGNIGGS
jgi:hypothetical protein